MNNNNENKNNDKKIGVPIDVSVYILYLYQDKGIRGKELLDRFPKYSKATVYQHSKRTINGEHLHDKRKQNQGRPPILNQRDKRNIFRQIQVLRESEGASFTVNIIRVAAGITPTISDMTII